MKRSWDIGGLYRSWDKAVRLVLLIGVLSACASGGFDSAQKTSELYPGMTYQQVVALLGPPQTSEFAEGKRVATFSLHQSWRGNVPFDLVFSGEPPKLESWSENKEKFAAGQKSLGQLTEALTAAFSSSANGENSAPAGPNDPQLQKQIAGTWWGYSGSTERKIGLCPDGSYLDYTESGYSGRMHDSGGYQTGAWGAASQSGGQGQWTINGSTQSGTIHVRYADGSTANVQYRQINDPGCLSFDGNTLCRNSANCQ